MSRTMTMLPRAILKNLLVMVSAVVLLQACGGHGGGGSTPPAVPVITASPGYFDNVSTTGGANVFSDVSNTIPLAIADLQGMVYGNKFTLVSVTNNLAYYATITSLSGINYTADVVIYKDNIPYENTTLSGTLTAGVSIAGTFANSGTAYGHGSFRLDYSLANTPTVTDVSRIVRDNTTPIVRWRNIPAAATAYSTLQIQSTGVLLNGVAAGSGIFVGCFINGTISPVSSTALYQVSMTLTFCSTAAVNGTYTGTATSRQQTTADDRLIVTVTSGTYSMNGEFE